ncbi:MAG: hypothetical protein KME30_26140 [Iphinoe sp. HA4291-MV1]|jgi:anti-sigma28 factor (negative regulator of flagellin synthesis)|nr:hypothetical protein [Iphinoe sp. HA4291-MV1]
MSELSERNLRNIRSKKIESSLTEGVQKSFKSIGDVPTAVVNQIERGIEDLDKTLELVRTKLEKDKKVFDDNGNFKGWNNHYVASVLCKELGIEKRFYLNDNILLKLRRKSANFIFGHGPYEEIDKAYIPPSIANMVSFHNAIQRLGIAFALITGLSFGELLSEETLNVFGLKQVGTVKIIGAVAVNTLVFGGSTKATEKFVSEDKNAAQANHFARAAKFALIVALCKAPMVGFTGVAGSAHQFTATDRTLYAQIQAQSQFEKASSKTQEAIQKLEEGGKLYSQLKQLNAKPNKSEQEKAQIEEIKNTLKEGDYPTVVSLYGEQLYLENLKSVAEANRGKNDGSQKGINREAWALNFLGLKYISGRGFLETGQGEYNKETQKIQKNMQVFEAQYIEGSRPKLDFIRKAEIMKEDFARLTAWQWLDKWLPSLTSDQEAKAIIDHLKTVDLNQLSSSEKINLVKLKLHDEFNYGGKVPSFVAYVFIALLFEALSSLTLGVLYFHKDFSQKYANTEFQGSYQSVVDLVKVEVSKKMNNRELAKPKVPQLNASYGVYSTIIDQIMREKPIAGVSSLIEQYAYETYSPKYKQLKKKQEIEALREKGVDVRHPIVRAVSLVISLLKKKDVS